MIDAAPMPDASGTVAARLMVHPDVVFLTTRLDGSGSSDQSGRTLSYAWHFTKVPNGSAVTDAALSGAMASFVPDRGGDYSVTLTVTAGSDSAMTSADFTVPTVAMFHYAMTATADTSQLAPRLVRSDGTGDKLLACGESLDAGTAHWDAGPSDMMNRLFFSAFDRALDVFAPDPIAQPMAHPRMAFFERTSRSLLVVDEASACPGTPVRVDDPTSGHGAGFVRFSLDGNRLAYLELTNLAPQRVTTVAVDGSVRHIVRANPSVDPLPARVPPVWVDAQRLAWVEAAPNTTNNFSIMEAADLSDLPPVTELLSCVGVFDAIDQIGFTGTEVLLSARPPGGTFDLYREPMGGPCDTTRKLTNEPPYSRASDFDIAPDGMHVVYVSAKMETQVAMGQRQPGDIWLVLADGSGQPSKLVGAMGLSDYQPRWIAGGRQLAWTRLPAGEYPDAGGAPTGLLIANADGTGERVIAEDSAIPGDVTLRLGSSNGGNACSGLPGMITGGGWLVVLFAIALSVRGRAKRASRASRSGRT
jgi:hypothetical protein